MRSRKKPRGKVLILEPGDVLEAKCNWPFEIPIMKGDRVIIIYANNQKGVATTLPYGCPEVWFWRLGNDELYWKKVK